MPRQRCRPRALCLLPLLLLLAAGLPLLTADSHTGVGPDAALVRGTGRPPPPPLPIAQRSLLTPR